MEECASPTQAHSSIIITLYGRDYPFRACRPNLADALVGRVLQNSLKKESKSLNFHKLRLFYVHKIL